MSQKDKNTAQKAFEMVDKVYGKSQKQTPKPYVARDEFASRFIQNSYEYGVPKFYTVKEVTSRTSCSRLIYQYESSTIKEPVVSHSTNHINYFGGARPLIGHSDWFERPRGQAISCDDAVKLYGGVLIKEFRN